MARISHEREDLLRDARALVPRVQFRTRLGGAETTIVAGFRGAALSLYFGDDPAYHFNADGDLRRAFVADRLIKAVRGKLVAMSRVRTEHEVVLQPEDLSGSAYELLMSDLNQRLSGLKAALALGAAEILGQVPQDGNALERLAAWLEFHPVPGVAASPRVN